MKKVTTLGLAIAIFLQAQILAGLYVLSALPLWTGTEIVVKTVPVDPRSMFRGNYARLRYDFSSVPVAELVEQARGRLRVGEIVYTELKKTATGSYEPGKTFLKKPDSGVFLRGRIQKLPYYYRRRNSNNALTGTVTVKYGIEAFFAPKEEALRLERELRSSASAVLMVDSNGKARIKEIKA